MKFKSDSLKFLRDEYIDEKTSTDYQDISLDTIIENWKNGCEIRTQLENKFNYMKRGFISSMLNSFDKFVAKIDCYDRIIERKKSRCKNEQSFYAEK